MKIFNRNKDVSKSNHSINAESDLPLLGSGEQQRAERSSAWRRNAQDQEDFHSFDENEGLPSVNRGRGNNKFVSGLGFGVIGLLALGVLYAQTGGSGEAPEKKPVEEKLANNLPAFSLPEPPPPPQAASVPPLQPEGQPIPVQDKGAKHTAPTIENWADRKMSGSMLIKGVDESNSAATTLSSPKESVAREMPDVSALGRSFVPTVTKTASAELLPNRNYVIAKGTSLDCALETAMDSTVPGLTTCRLTRDVYSDNGHVVLLDRGSQLVGEYQGGITAGQARIFVLWTRAKTPNGVVIALDSPGTDALGRAGHEGWVDTHFMERFGAAILLSLVKDTFAYARSTQTKSGNETVTIGGGGSDQLSTEILKNTINIPPTLYVNQGDHIQIMVARDLNFASVYGLDLKQ